MTETEKVLGELSEILKKLGWMMVINTGQDDDDTKGDVKGLIIGQGEYIDYILGHL